MANSTSSFLKLTVQATGENSGTWGQITNTNLLIVEQAIAGYEAVALNATTGATLTFSKDNSITCEVVDDTKVRFRNEVTSLSGSANTILLEMGYDLSNYSIFTTEMWVQEFAKRGGGHHTLHTHWNGHISGFYFLKASETTSLPLFEDPRPGNLMNGLPELDKSKVTYASTQINYKVEPGSMIFFPSYMPHQYVVDMGYEPFRFIHWNCQAIPKAVLNA